MHLNGASPLDIQLQGRWNSDTFTTYVHEQISAFFGWPVRKDVPTHPVFLQDCWTEGSHTPTAKNEHTGPQATTTSQLMQNSMKTNHLSLSLNVKVQIINRKHYPKSHVANDLITATPTVSDAFSIASVYPARIGARGAFPGKDRPNPPTPRSKWSTWRYLFL